eukprot:TRINITY_DN60831_c0_g1_i1.p1 TRINITY_DN60831_c0_g1~~TRINITY_DN60831_c0_g1_i1.p1  ORF type:complete len:828 (-),score=132.71 TRINITY_DN60831_c0_g1_i1:120-2603(-)
MNVLNAAQQSSLLAFLRVMADHELSAEQTRRRLCEANDFDPYDTFKCLQGGYNSQKGYVSAMEVFRWVKVQPHHFANAHLEEIASMLAPFVNVKGELRYEGFLRIVLPKDPANTWLKDSCLARKSAPSQMLFLRGTSPVKNHGLPKEVAFRLCQLFENEVNMHRHLQIYREGLSDSGVKDESVLKFLDSEQGVCAGMCGLVSPNAVRRVLVDRVQALTPLQCDGLLRRINPSGACLAAFDELTKYLSPPLPPVEPSPSPQPQWSTPQRSPQSGRLFDCSLRAERDVTTERDTALRTSAGSGPWSSPPTPLKHAEPMGCQSYDMFSTPRGARRGLSAASSPVKATEGYATKQETAFSPSTPLPPYSNNDISTAAASSLHMSDNLSTPWATPPQKKFAFAEGLEGASFRETWPFSSRGSPNGHIWSPSPYDHKEKYSPCQVSPGQRLASTQASTADLFSPRSPVSPRYRGFHSPSLRPSEQIATAQLRSTSVPATYRNAASAASHAAASAAAAAAQAAAAAAAAAERVPRYSPWTSDGTLQAVRRLLEVIASQAAADARTEDAKTLLPPNCNLEAIFASLDRFGKGYISDSDFWQLAQDFGGHASFSAITALVHELQLRQPRARVVVPGRISLRELATLVLPLGSPELKHVREAPSDDEAKSVLYLLRHSEPCPQCGLRAQRSAECAGCPIVSCPACRTHFQCHCVVGDFGSEALAMSDGQLSVTEQYHVYRMVDTAARAAELMERERKQLATEGYDLSALSDVFNYLADGLLHFRLADLRRALADCGISCAEKELDSLWYRYAPNGNSEASFPEFARQLKPRFESPIA